MSGVKRYDLQQTGLRTGSGDPLPKSVVAEYDYDALAQRCRELEAKQTRTEKARSGWEENATLLEQERDTLRAEVEQLRKALAPFAKCAAVFDASEYAGVFYEWKRRYREYELTVADLRAARAAMEPES